MMFSVSHLHFSYGAVPTLQDVNLQAAPGRLHAIVGPNGAGKSTLIKLLAGLLEADRGDILYDARPIGDLSDRQRALRMAYMAQDTAAPEDFTAKEIIEMARYARDDARGDEAAVLEAMERTRTFPFADRKVGQLSGGERQRVMLARAFAQGADALLLDEVTSALDMHYQLAVMEDLRDWLAPHRIILMVLHDINLAARYADEIWMLSDKTIFRHGKPSEVLTPETIRAVYQVDSITDRNPVTDSPIVIPVEHSMQNLPLDLHVISGGGSGQSLYAALYRMGARVQTGVLNAGDTDHTIARRLGMKIYPVAAFSPVEEEDIRAVRTEGVDAVLITNLPVGPGNGKNLELALKMAEEMPLLYCPWQRGPQFVYKDSERLWQKVVDRAVFCPDEESLRKELEKIASK